MRWIAVVLLVISFPALASAVPDAEPSEDPGLVTEDPGRDDPPRTCRTIAKQINHFEGVLDEARDRDNELWEEATKRHLGRLRAEQFRRCPDDVPPDLAAAFWAFLLTMGQIALTVFTMGLY